ncbi:CREB-binding protein [Halotydeus destructor]|nr:CREB-binding protein [Halotydeus destructor]
MSGTADSVTGSGPQPSKRLKLSDSTDSLPAPSESLLWDLESELPDELALSSTGGGSSLLDGPPLVTNNNLPAANCVTSGPSLSLQNISVNSSPISSVVSSQPNSFIGHQQQPPNANNNQHLSQLLGARTVVPNVTVRPHATPLQQQLMSGMPGQQGQQMGGHMGPGNRPLGQQQQIRYGQQASQGPGQNHVQMLQQTSQQQFLQQQTFQSPQQQQQRAMVQNQMRYGGPQNAGQGPLQQTPGQPNMMAVSNVQQQQQQQQHSAPSGPLVTQMTAAQQQQQLTPPPGGTADPEKRKLIQQQLVLLLHAHKCQRREQQQSSQNGVNTPDNLKQCSLPHCKTMKNVLNHMTNCTAGKNCTVSHCASSRQIISHWKNCTRTDCPVCLPLKQASDRRQQQQQGMQGAQSLFNSINMGPSSLPSSQNLPVLPLTPQPLVPTTGSNGPGQMQLRGPQPQGIQQQQQQQQQQQPGPQPQNNQSSLQMQKAYQTLGLDAFSSMTGTSSPQPGSNQNRNFQPNQQKEKEWHSSVTVDLRNHLVQKIVQAIFPNPDPSAVQDRRMSNLFAYAKKVEGDMYEMANSREEYYHLLAEKIYKIQKELEEKRQKRKEQQQMASGVGNSINTGPLPPQQQQAQLNMMLGQPTTSPGIRMQQPSLPPGTRMTLQNNQGPPNATLFNGSNQLTNGGPMQNQQYNFMSPTPGGLQSQPQPRAQTSTTQSTGYTTNQTLQSMLSQGISPQPNPLQPNTPQPPSVSSATPPPPRPLSVSNSNGMPPQIQFQQGQVKAEAGQAPSASLSGKIGMKSENEDADALNKLVTIKTEPLDDLLGTSTSSSTTQCTSAVSTALNSLIKQEASSSVDSAMSTSTAIPSATTPTSQVKKEETDDSVISSSDSKAIASNAGSTNEPTTPTIKDEIDSKPNSNAPLTPAPSTPAKPSAPRQKKVFKPDELRFALMPTIGKMWKQDPESLPFRQPVDPQMLQIPDYFDIIKVPMDLSTIKDKLEHGHYQDPWQYVDDVYLMFNNAWLYNKKSSRVYRYCTKLSEVFEQEIDPVMQSLGYCCGRKFVFQPQTLCCYGKQLCTIPRDVKYMSYQNRITYCMKCFSELTGDTVTVGDVYGLEPGQTSQTVQKNQFVELKNDHLDYEPFIDCKDCGRKLHQICVVHNDAIWPEGYTCDACLRAKTKKRKENKYTAKRLPQTKLSNYIESRVNNYLRKKEANAGDVSIRVVSSSDKTVEVKPGMRKRFVEGEGWPDSFPYKAKALFAFEDFNGVDVCFFGMHVQEYGSDCPQPNARRVYIAYLDSVHFFKPKQFRTAVYHEILLGYLDYAKQAGFTMAHIWACPPSEGDDYIFHCHPIEQKIPKPKRLQEWYRKMLDKGMCDRIVLDYKDILKQANEDNVKSAMDLAYFEGDFWPNVIEESIKEIEMEQAKAIANEASVDNTGNQSDDESMDATNESGDKTGANGVKSELGSSKSGSKNENSNKQSTQKKSSANKKSNKKQNQRKNNPHQRHKSGGQLQQAQTPLSQAQQWEQELTGKIFSHMEKHKEVFFVIRLHSVQTAANLPSIVDPDGVINCDLMDGRDAFLTMAREKHYEFSSLRRAKWSSMALLYELHNNNGFVYTCNKCKRNLLETRYHCTECDDFDLCVSCWKTEQHPHRMEPITDMLGAVGDDPAVAGAIAAAGDHEGGGDASGSATSPGESRRLSIQRCIQSLVHACQCRDANCRLPSCHKMKRVVQHAKTCKRRTGNQAQTPACPICKQLIALCCFHAKHCNEAKCLVPYCINIKQKLKQQQAKQRFQQQQLLRRRMATMSSMSAAINAAHAQTSTPAPAAPPPAQNEYPSPVAPTSNSTPFSQKPMTVTPPPGAVHAVQQIQAAVSRQAQQQMPGGKGGGGGKNFHGGGGGKGGGKGKGGMVFSQPSTPTNQSPRPPGSSGMGLVQQQPMMHQQQRMMMSQQPGPNAAGQPPQYGQQQSMQPQSQGPVPQQQWQMQGQQQPQRFMQQRLQGPAGQQMISQGPPQQQQQTLLHQQLAGPNQMQMQQGQNQMNMNPQQQQQLLQQQLQQQPGMNQNAGAGPSAQSPGAPGAGQAEVAHSLQQLLSLLKSQNSPQQQEKAAQILRRNPQMLAALLKQRERQLQQTQQGGVPAQVQPGMTPPQGQQQMMHGQQMVQQQQPQPPQQQQQAPQVQQQQWGQQFNQQPQQQMVGGPQRMTMNAQQMQGGPPGGQQQRFAQQPQQQMYQQQRFASQPQQQQWQQQGQVRQMLRAQQPQRPRFAGQPGAGPQQAQAPQDPDMLLFQQNQNDFGNGQPQQQEIPLQDQLSKFVDNL